jgi:hypothetical protein
LKAQPFKCIEQPSVLYTFASDFIDRLYIALCKRLRQRIRDTFIEKNPQG